MRKFTNWMQPPKRGYVFIDVCEDQLSKRHVLTVGDSDTSTVVSNGSSGQLLGLERFEVSIADLREAIRGRRKV